MDESRFGRTKRISRAKIHKIRRDFQIYLDRRGLEEPLVDLCRRYGILDDDTGGPRRAEATRLLLYVAFMRNQPHRVQATVESAVRSNKPMLIGGMMKRLQSLFATASSLRPSNQPTGNGTSKVHLVLDDWIYQAMQACEASYRAVDGVVDDIRMTTDAIRAALSDPALPQIAQLYAARMAPLRDAIRKMEAYNRTMLIHALGQERPIEELLQRTA